MSQQHEKKGWYTRTALAEIFGVSVSQVDRKYSQLTGDKEEHNGKTYYRARSIIDAVVAAAVADAKVKTGEDPLMAGVDSPGLERYRNAKADLTEMERDRLRKQIVRVDELEPALLQLAGVMRGASESLARQYGNEASGIVNEAVDEWTAGVTRLFEKGNGQSGTATPDPSVVVDEGGDVAYDETVRGGGVDTTDRPA